MKATSVTALLLSVAFASAALAAAPSYKIVDRIKVQDGGFDYATYDPDTGQILIARPNLTTTIDGKTGKVGEIKSARAGHGAFPVPGTGLVVVPQRAGNILLVDVKTDKLVATLKGTKNPDGAAYDPATKLVFVMNHDGGDSTVVDPVAKKVVGTIPVGGDLEFPKVGYSHRGKTGDGIFFASQRDGKPDPMSLHAAKPVVQGEKYIISQWIHNQAFGG